MYHAILTLPHDTDLLTLITTETKEDERSTIGINDNTITISAKDATAFSAALNKITSTISIYAKIKAIPHG